MITIPPFYATSTPELDWFRKFIPVTIHMEKSVTTVRFMVLVLA
jgi:hypothetical protein